MSFAPGRLPLIALALLLLAACASQASTRQSVRDSHRSLSIEDMHLTGPSDLYSVIQSLRPQWLRPRGVSSVYLDESVKVYLDNSLLGGPETLRQISTQSVYSVEYLDGVQASQRWGLDHGAGAVMVYSRRR